MALTLATFISGDTNYIAELNDNFGLIGTALDAVQAASSIITVELPLMVDTITTPGTSDFSILPFIPDNGIVDGMPGVVPATSKGDAAAGKFLCATGGWVVPKGGGNGGGGIVPTTAIATAIVSGGIITSAIINSGGSGYNAPPTITFSDSTGSGATAVCTITGGVVVTLTITNGGTGYTAPTIAFNALGGLTALAPLVSSGGSSPTISITDFVGDTGAGGVNGIVPAPAAGDAAALKFLMADGTWAVPAGSSGGAPYDVICSLMGLPGANVVVFMMVFTRTVTFPINFAGSVCHVGALPTGSVVYTILRNGGIVGSITIDTGGGASFSTSGGGIETFVAADLMTVVSPTTQDATLADVAFTIVGAR